ncbi:MAG: hypothetical protein A2509_04885 [Candidatus Edwardsbacteria bacterium RIFOXYD12_FULL_50_11]|uniref:Uncharacterized protein n=1 Tax=Candidatus Edwardsbacteria bacterium GWF2_54_11 TaxID=1817851 RepID=A0A1F5RHC5_9BACT|nr:MAG: hypothetical protein A2502_01030 [Candidatus Edwardsbacteria bacterium RifOxyC12_full_54_24]OGF06119.1 MAG: hypothetical protein A2273_11150 [Candidatus Edwardsbacteria bacterium RifOxyA12_full_54_48]OGF12614.1 MAG: hypothetical protein A3K15_02120 [Candidatus Edwardsbacteria bacterium GWE2_54_12]OGF13850.1 MAG: hypothetical protein A2024_10390 [Candidatus Edwardsbacteria bacterium GWF2_54_11]OGF17823.1 MAG: hypothetical protein A2509_04885 [Candidatus Edwardsbacteria bacterium RIFOXYD1
MKSIKIIRVNAFKNGDPDKLTIQGVWGGRLDVDFARTNGKSSAASGQGSGEILAYLPPFTRNIILEPDGFLINAAPEISFRVFLLDGKNTILLATNPNRIGGSDIWQCKVPPNIFRNVHKILIN